MRSKFEPATLRCFDPGSVLRDILAPSQGIPLHLSKLSLKSPIDTSEYETKEGVRSSPNRRNDSISNLEIAE